LAFCAKPVFGRLTVFFSSSGACVDMKGHILREFPILTQPNGKTKPGEIHMDGQDLQDRKNLRFELSNPHFFIL
jgi:hypothetical protein